MKRLALHVLFILFSVGATISCSQLSSGPAVYRQTLPILQGATNENSVELSVMAKKSDDLQFVLITPAQELHNPSKQEVRSIPESEWAVHKIQFTKLPGTQGAYRFIVRNSLGAARDERELFLFDSHGEGLRFIVASCMDESYPEAKTMWEQVEKISPEAIFLMGDNWYGGHPGPDNQEKLWNRAAKTRLSTGLYHLKRLIPTYATWDDHDYGINDGNSSHPYRQEATAIFEAFTSQTYPNTILQRGPGVASRLLLRGMHFVLLDNRSFRAAEKEGKHFGEEQEQWFFTTLKESARPTWIISGDQFFGGYHKYESFEGSHPQDFQSFLTQLRAIATPFVFVSGDRHMSELMQFPRPVAGQLSYEFTSSPAHAKVYPGSLQDGGENPWRVTGHDASPSIMLLTTKLTDVSWDIKSQAIGTAGEIFFERDFSLTIEPLKDFSIERKIRRRRYRRGSYRRGRR